jgi:hypothetical protein
MNEDDKRRAQALVNKLLKEAGDKATSGEYRSALTAVKKAKALDQGNVFLLALERQLEQIGDLAMTGSLTDAQKSDILGSVPRLVDQATNSPSVLEHNPATPAAAAEAEEARLAAGRWLKNQYFQRAHEFVRTGEYDHALGELRKIFSIDDQDQVAREFEMKIMQMLELKRHQSPALRPEAAPKAQPQAPVEPAAQPEKPAGEEPPARGGRSVLITTIILTLIAILLGAFYFWHRHNTGPVAPRVKDSIEEKADDAPLYPVPPSQVAPDTTARDSVKTP